MVVFFVIVLLFYASVTSSVCGSDEEFHGALPDFTRIPIANDPVGSIEVVYPAHGAIEKAPVGFKTQINIRPEGAKLFASQYKNASVCVEVNGVVVDCSQIGGISEFRYYQAGNCTVRAYLKRSGLQEVVEEAMFDFESALVSFTVINENDYEEHIARAIRNNEANHRPGFRQSLVEWANLQLSQPSDRLLQRLKLAELINIRETEVQDDLQLIVGVRTAVVTHFFFRQAIRETWASKSALPTGVKVIFLGCRPIATVSKDEGDKLTQEAELRKWWEAIELEKRVYGDLLTDELDCDDSYSRLADKTKQFLRFAATNHPTAKFVMVADDDLYLRLDKVIARLQRLDQSKRYYAGHVRAIEDATKQRPIRDPESRNYLSNAQYALNELPPFALGANFFLSMDCVRFVARNHRRLRDLGGMDDISVALWMLSMQVHPKPFNGLNYLNSGTCRDDLVSLSDIHESAIRVIHTNIQERRRICHDFQRRVWLRQGIGASNKGHSRPLTFTRENLDFEFAWTGHLIATVSTKTRAGVKVAYFPANETFPTYLRKLCIQVIKTLPNAITTCANLNDQVRTQLQELHNKLAADTSVDTTQRIKWNLFLEET
ncbi:Galactosyltransferase [Phytophthora infestans]|uniref:Galactosyltransferase n=1 Tax=Phytophthora infestans TaxID=4787 RepID=A0A8S9TJF2_PHYIN|nr:Galactosyltransferase [Phytophthora infestans]